MTNVKCYWTRKILLIRYSSISNFKKGLKTSPCYSRNGSLSRKCPVLEIRMYTSLCPSSLACKYECVEALQLHSDTQSHWSSGSTVCLLPRGSAVHIQGIHPHVQQWNWVLLTMIGPLCSRCRDNRSVSPSANPVRRILVPYIPSMSMMVIGHSLLYKDKDGAVCCMMFIELLDDDWCLMGSKYLEYNSRIRKWTIKRQKIINRIIIE